MNICRLGCLARALALITLLWSSAGCSVEQRRLDDPAGDTDSSSDGGGDLDTDTDTESETDTGTDTEHYGPAIPETCVQAPGAATSYGCLFYAIDLDSHDSNDYDPYGVVVTNPSPDQPATVTVRKGDGVSSWLSPTTGTVEPKSHHTFELDSYAMPGSGFGAKMTYKVESDLPVAAYQFNPIDAASSYLSDSTALIPVHGWSSVHEVVGWKQTEGDGDMRAYFTVVAAEDDTEVTVTPAVEPLAGGPVPPSSDPFSVEMDEGDVLEVQTNGVGDSLTGSRIEAAGGKPIAVFTAQECAYIPDDVEGCDHLEEQLPGLEYWGTEFVAARLAVRTHYTAESSDEVLWQIYALEDDTEVQLSADPAVTGLPESLVLMAAETAELYVGGGAIEHPGDFHILADKPVAVLQYMTSSANPGVDGAGDPAMAYLPPVDQLLPRFVVPVPPTWSENELTITRPAGADVLIDGSPVSSAYEFYPTADSGWEVARIPVEDGVHVVESDDEDVLLGVIVTGWDYWDSHAYVGGMGLAEINPLDE